jgi:uncharacterized protein (TIGR03000 family)
MLRKLSILALAATLLVAGASPAYAQRGGGRGGMGGGGGGRGGGGGNWGGYRGGNWGGYNNNNNNWGAFAVGVGVGALARPYGGYGGYYGGYGYSSPGYYYSDPGYSSNYVVPSTSYYSGPADAGYTSAAPAMPANAATINMRVPPNAQVFFGDQQATTGNTGTYERRFVSPPLDPGSNYQYQLRAQWMENGQMVNRVRTVAVHANDVVNVDFMSGS